jgi:hypothetical protein
MHESAVIDNLLTRIAAAKLAYAEANEQSAQLAQALEAEDAAVSKVCFAVAFPAFLLFSFWNCRSWMSCPSHSCSSKPSKMKFQTRMLE